MKKKILIMFLAGTILCGCSKEPVSYKSANTISIQSVLCSGSEKISEQEDKLLTDANELAKTVQAEREKEIRKEKEYRASIEQASQTEQTEQIASTEQITRTPGTHEAPKLYISGTDVDITLCASSFYDIVHQQGVVDNPDLAAFISDGGPCSVIADHAYQGFEAMKGSVPGSTTACIDYGDYTENYICTHNCLGTNTGHGVFDDNNIFIAKNTENNIAMYTCNENWQNVTITYWKRI